MFGLQATVMWCNPVTHYILSFGWMEKKNPIKLECNFIRAMEVKQFPHICHFHWHVVSKWTLLLCCPSTLNNVEKMKNSSQVLLCIIYPEWFPAYDSKALLAPHANSQMLMQTEEKPFKHNECYSVIYKVPKLRKQHFSLYNEQ